MEKLAWSAAGSVVWTAGDERMGVFADSWRLEGVVEGCAGFGVDDCWATGVAVGEVEDAGVTHIDGFLEMGFE